MIPYENRRKMSELNETLTDERFVDIICIMRYPNPSPVSAGAWPFVRASVQKPEPVIASLRKVGAR